MAYEPRWDNVGLDRMPGERYRHSVKVCATRTLLAVRYRMIYGVLAVVALSIAALGFVFAPEGGVTTLEPPIEEVFPLPNNAVIRQTTVEVDLEVGYEATIFVDGFAIPPGELSFSDATGVYRWAPFPGSLVMDGWEPGDHVIRVEWVRIVGSPLRGDFEWTFRVQ